MPFHVYDMEIPGHSWFAVENNTHTSLSSLVHGIPNFVTFPKLPATALALTASVEKDLGPAGLFHLCI